MMQPRTLGRSGIAVSAMGLGCWGIGGPLWQGDRPFGWGQVDDRESVRAIRRAVDLGISFFDTADLYGAGHSEEVLGRALAGHRDEVVIATKWGHTFDPVTRQRGGADTTPGYVRRALAASLRRLGTDHVDLYQFHVADAHRATRSRSGRSSRSWWPRAASAPTAGAPIWSTAPACGPAAPTARRCSTS
jgi:aryl-alcohol dehydrogenase-like predicted oxidoreductase